MKAHGKNPQNQLLAAYDEHADAIFRHCYFRCGGVKERAEEMVQETFLRAWEYTKDGKKVENMRAFLYRIATNLAIDQSRRQKRIRESSLDQLAQSGFDPEVDTQEQTIDYLEGKRIAGMLSQMGDKDKTVIVLRYINDFTPAEIAEVLNESTNVVSVRLHRAQKKLKEIAEKHDE